MKLRKPKKKDIILLVVITLLIIPQTRQPIQVALHSILSQFGPSVISKENQKKITYSPWKLKNLDGSVLNFEDTKGKVIFVNLWATWCPPCIAEFQGIQDLFDVYKDKVEFIMVSSESPKIIQKFLNKKEYEIPVFNPLTNYPNEFNARSIPRTYIIDKNGYIVVDKKGAANWNSGKIRRQLDKLLIE